MDPDFGKYRLLRLLGEGGMAHVWAARWDSPGGPRPCAIKIIKPAIARNPQLRAMFEREGRLARALGGHDNLVSVLDMGTHRGRAYLAMELVEGVTLADMVRRVGGPWSVNEAVAVVVGVLRALSHVHALRIDGEPRAIVHRDVTPHNVMISARGDVKLVDFGIAQRADAAPRFDQALGKLRYVPHEQVEGDADQRSDLYAAGAVLFELLDGRRFRWHCADEDALFQEIYRDRVPSLRRKDVPAPVRAVLRGLLEPRRERRIATAAQALRKLEAWQARDASGLRGLYRRAVGAPPRRSSDGLAAVEVGAPRGHRLWDEVRVTTEHRAPSSASPGKGRARPPRAPTPTASVPVTPEPSAPRATTGSVDRSGVVQRRSHSRTVSVAAWVSDDPSRRPTGEEHGVEDALTRAVPAARPEPEPEPPIELIERFVTRRHPAALPEADVPIARAAAEIAVTEPQPSRRAPWAEGTEPIEHRVVRPEPGAPVKRRRLPSGTGDHPRSNERTGSISPRERQSVSLHRAAGDSDIIVGEIITDDGPSAAFAAAGWTGRR